MNAEDFKELSDGIESDLKDLIVAYLKMHSALDTESVTATLISALLANAESLMFGLLRCHNADMKTSEKFINIMFDRSKQAILNRLKETP